jgi:hypothetical protein
MQNSLVTQHQNNKKRAERQHETNNTQGAIFLMGCSCVVRAEKTTKER